MDAGGGIEHSEVDLLQKKNINNTPMFFHFNHQIIPILYHRHFNIFSQKRIFACVHHKVPKHILKNGKDLNEIRVYTFIPGCLENSK
jgi:hypothetical protein